jgi:hypothetical protein
MSNILQKCKNIMWKIMSIIQCFSVSTFSLECCHDTEDKNWHVKKQAHSELNKL